MNKKKVAVIFGGVSPEYDVSLNSSYSIIKAINYDKYEVIMLAITRQGQWYKYTGDIENIPNDKWHLNQSDLTPAIITPSRSGGIMEFIDGQASILPIDVVFPVLHGKNGEDGTVQGLCELAGIPVVGSGSAASALCMDKDRAHKLVEFHGIAAPKSVSFDQMPSNEELHLSVSELKLPLFVKPVKTGSSFGITMVENYSELYSAVQKAFNYDDVVIIEEGISGFEVGCAVMGNKKLMVGRIDEIELSHGFFTYEEKYTLKTSKIIVPARVDKDIEQRLQETSKEIYRILGCKGYARVDLFLSKDKEIVFNEVNTIPGFTSKSRFAKMMKGVGMEYAEVVNKLIELGLEQ